MPRLALLLVCVVALGAGLSGCQESKSPEPPPPILDEAKKAGKFKEDFPPSSVDYFAQMDQAVPADGGTLAPLQLEAAEIRGRNTWMLWVGGNEGFWDWLAGYNPGFIDLLKLLDFSPQNRWPRFEQAGLIVEPDTVVPASPDRYGLYIRESKSDSPRPDEAIFGRSSGIVGLRLFPNPKFDKNAAKRWDAKRYRNEPAYYLDPALVRPYRVGMSCAFCHVGPHPLNPPADVEAPEWSNLSATIGNQYLRTRAVFGNLLRPDDFYYHLLDSQLPGTLDTSLIPSDNINNANAQNAIFELGGRLLRSGILTDGRVSYDDPNGYGVNPPEVAEPVATRWPVLFHQPGGTYSARRAAPRFLIDGADSVGPWAALARVYLNIGTYWERWETLHNPLFGFSTPKPFSMKTASQDSVYWAATEALMDDLARYLVKASSPMRLKDAPPGEQPVPGSGVPWGPEYADGRRVFAERCIVCHSSKQPTTFDQTPAESVLSLLVNQEYRQWADDQVKTPEFWQHNYLSTDRRLPVTLIGTNAARSLGSNGLEGQMWEDFSSSTYKALPSVGAIDVRNPFTGKNEKVEMPGRGRGYYRPPSLVGIWATAPFLHNNSVGNFNNDPSVDGRTRAFEDGIEKLLAEGTDDDAAAATRRSLGSDLNGSGLKRIQDDRGVIWRLPHPARLQIPAKQLPVLVGRVLGVPVAWLWALPFVLFTAVVPVLVGSTWSRRIVAGLLLVISLIAALAVIGVAPRFVSDCNISLTARVPILLFAMAMVVLLGSRWSRRIAAAIFVLLAFTSALLVAAVAGYLVDVSVRLPAGLPVDVVANLNFDALAGEKCLGVPRVARVARLLGETGTQNVAELGGLLDGVSRNRDHVMDRGHHFGAQLNPADRAALIALLRTF